MTILIWIQISSGIGLVISLYFLAIYKGWVNWNTHLVPAEVCSKNTCADVSKTRFARVFGLPNFVLGISYYVCIFFLTIFVLDRIYWLVAFLVSVAVVIFSGYLANSLIRVLKVPCNLCFASHLINVAIMVLLTTVIF